MDRNSAIERWRVPLLGHVLALFAEIGLTEGGTVERVPKPVYRYVLGILRKAESAVRRLIVAAARDIVVEYKPRRPASVKPKTPARTKARPMSKPSPNASAARYSGCSTRSSAFAAASKRSAVDPSPASASSITIPGFRGSSGNTSHHRHPCPLLPFQTWKRPSTTAWSMPGIWSAVSSPPRMLSKTSRARPCASQPGRPVPRKSAVLSAGAPCAPAGRRASASGQSTRSTRSSKNATGSPLAGTRRSTTRRKAHSSVYKSYSTPLPSWERATRAVRPEAGEGALPLGNGPSRCTAPSSGRRFATSAFSHEGRREKGSPSLRWQDGSCTDQIYGLMVRWRRIRPRTTRPIALEVCFPERRMRGQDFLFLADRLALARKILRDRARQSRIGEIVQAVGRRRHIAAGQAYAALARRPRRAPSLCAMAKSMAW